MKIPLLLVQYLYKNRKMSLPGLGIFTLDKSVVLPDEQDRALLSMPNAVQFQNANIAAADKDLIQFICEHTGKIRPLAISDLDSYLNLGTEMLNIGKPFYLEGIGTITKNKSGKFDFAPGEYAVIKENTSSQDNGRKKAQIKEKKEISLTPPAQTKNVSKILGILLAIAVVAGGGWLMYKKNTTSNTETTPVSELPVAPPTQPAILTDSVKKDSVRIDSANIPPSDTKLVAATVHEGTVYKFVILETNDKARAMRRYEQLVSYDLKAHYTLKDSTYKIYFEFPALTKDTTHIKDSLRREYAHDVLVER